MLKSAKILYAGSAVDCLVLDLSETGLRISTDAFMPFPDEVTVELRSGGQWAAHLRWQRGLESGFELVRFLGLGLEAAGDASRLLDRLRNAGLVEVTASLAEARYFDHLELKSATVAVAAAVERLEGVLRRACAR